MLTIYIYKNVPFQINNENVLFIDNDNAKMQYLSQYLQGTKTNIQKFFSNEKYFDLDILYEDCNYMAIYDDRSTTPYKYFFIQKAYFVSNGAVRYELTLDNWFTYGNRINMHPSRMCAGHLDTQNGHIIGTDPTRSINYVPSGEKSFYEYKPIIDTWLSTQNATMIVIGKTNAGNELFMCKIDNNAKMIRAIDELSLNKYAEIQQTPQFVAFENLKTYLINDVDLIDKISSLTSLSQAFRSIYMGIQTTADDEHPQWYRYANTTKFGNIWPDINLRLNLKSIQMFDNSTFDIETNKLKCKYFVGTKTNKQEIVITSRDNPTINLIYYQFKNNQCAFYLQYDTTMFNISNEFEIPFTNDSYTLYMAQNQATFDTANKSNALQLASQLGTAGLSFALSGVTGGTSLMLGASAITSGLNVGMKQMQQHASIENAKQSIDRSDGIYTAGLLTLMNGVYIYEVYFRFTQPLNDYINNFGTNQFCMLTDYKAYDTTLFNFNFIQFDDINIYGEFTYEIKINFENMFKNGVRIWYDSTAFLQNVNYKK